MTQVPAVSVVFWGTESYGKLCSKSACKTKLQSDGSVFPSSHVEEEEHWISDPVIPGLKLITSYAAFYHLQLTDHPLLSHPPLLHRDVILPNISDPQDVLQATRVAHSALRAAIVLNRWWLRPVWFCYSRSLQLERMPSLPTERTELGGYSYRGNRPVSPFRICKCRLILLPWAVLHCSSAATHLLQTLHSSISMKLPHHPAKSFLKGL